MELRHHLRVVRNRIWLVLAATVLAALVGLASAGSGHSYAATSTIFIGTRTPQPAAGDLSNDRLDALSRLTLTYAAMIDTPPIAARAQRATGVDRTADDIVRETVATPTPNTQLLAVQVRDRDATVAQRLANGLADTFVAQLSGDQPATGVGAVPTIPASVFERASRPTTALSTGRLRDALLGGLFGLLGGISLAFLLDHLDVSVRTPADVEGRLGLPVLGVIPALAGDAPFGDLATGPAGPVAAPPATRRKPAARRSS